jgi:hypothetical protein
MAAGPLGALLLVAIKHLQVKYIREDEDFVKNGPCLDRCESDGFASLGCSSSPHPLGIRHIHDEADLMRAMLDALMVRSFVVKLAAFNWK